MGAFAINTGVKLVGSLQNAGKAVTKLASTMVDALVPSSSAISDAFAAEGDSAEAAGAATDTAFGPIGLVLAGVAIAATLLVTHWKQVSKFLVGIWHDVSGFAKTVWNDLTGFFKKWGEDLLLAFVPVIGVPVFLATHWHKVEDDAKAIWGDIVGFFTKLPGEFVKALQPLVSGVEKVAKDAWSGFLKALNAGEALLKAYFVTIPTKIVTWLGDATLWLVNVAYNALRGFWNGFMTAEIWLGQEVRTLGTTIVTWLADAGTWLLHVGAEVISGLWQGVVAGWALLGNIDSTVTGWFTSALSDAVGWLVQTGKDVITGLWNGISSMGSWLYNQVSNFATSFVKNAIHDALSIFSPSRVTFQSGVYVAQGLAQGILSGAGLVENASRTIANAAANGLSGAGSSAVKIGTSAGLGATTAASSVPGTTSSPIEVNVYVTVEGHVLTEQNLVDAVYEGLLEKGLKNGTLFGVNL
jgi:phage-related protein